MEETKKFIIKENKTPIANGEILRSVKSWYVIHNEDGGYIEDVLDIELRDDGSVCVSNDKQWVFLDTEQAEVLRRFLMGEPQLENE